MTSLTRPVAAILIMLYVHTWAIVAQDAKSDSASPVAGVARQSQQELPDRGMEAGSSDIETRPQAGSSRVEKIAAAEEIIAGNKYLNPEAQGEKVYLHTDRMSYVQGDTLWFKAYCWYGYAQLPDTLSGVLYIDLLTSTGEPADQRRVLMHRGTAHGDFILSGDLAPGRYTLRAYTRWMKETRTGEPFYQTLTISPVAENILIDCRPVILKQESGDSLQVSFNVYEVSGTGDINPSISHRVNYTLTSGGGLMKTGETVSGNGREHSFTSILARNVLPERVAQLDLYIQLDGHVVTRRFNIPLEDDIDLQFFPEGGTMVSGLPARIAFKAVGTDGLGKDLHGVIVDGSGEHVASFESLHRGMGSFFMTPEQGKVYFADLEYHGQQYRVPLPRAQDQGSVMALSAATGEPDHMTLTVRQRSSDKGMEKFIVACSYGGIRYAAMIVSETDSCTVDIPLDNFPEGVTRFTLLDGSFAPECERLIYVDKAQRVRISIMADSASYSTRSKVTLYIETSDGIGNPVQADLSLAVVDRGQANGLSSLQGISAYKLLESEVKGNIEAPDYYFTEDSVSRYGALDALLLTQGYRAFEPVPETSAFQPEQSWEVSGRIKLPEKKETRIDYRDMEMLLYFKAAQYGMIVAYPDSTGFFTFRVPLMEGDPGFYVQARMPKDKPFKGEILVEEPYDTVSLGPYVPAVEWIRQATVETVRQVQVARKTENAVAIRDAEMFAEIPEVVVTARAKYWYKDFDANAEKIVGLDSLDPEGNRYGTLSDLLIEQFRARRYVQHGPSINLETVILPCLSIMGPNEWFPVYILDGTVYFRGDEMRDTYLGMLNFLNHYPINEIKRIMVIPPGRFSDHYAPWYQDLKPSIVVMETYENNRYRGDAAGTHTFNRRGLDAPRRFYAPVYDAAHRLNPVYDGRTTVHWEPSIATDPAGRATVEFYTSDRQTELETIVNGMQTGNGRTGHGSTSLHVENRP